MDGPQSVVVAGAVEAASFIKHVNPLRPLFDVRIFQPAIKQPLSRFP